MYYTFYYTYSFSANLLTLVRLNLLALQTATPGKGVLETCTKFVDICTSVGCCIYWNVSDIIIKWVQIITANIKTIHRNLEI